MTQPVEAQLRTALADLHLTTPLDDILWRGRQIRRQRRLPAYALLLTALIATAVVTADLGRGSGQTAFAGWRSKPALLHGAKAATAERLCRQAVGTPDNLGSPYLHADVPARLIEGRGPYAFAVLTDNVTAADCFMFIQPTGGTQIMARQAAAVAHRSRLANGRAMLAVEDIQILAPSFVHTSSPGHERTSPAGKAAAVWGWASHGVASIRILTDGQEIDASMHSGVFAAWWPISGKRLPAMTIQAYSAGGKKLATIERPAAR